MEIVYINAGFCLTQSSDLCAVSILKIALFKKMGNNKLNGSLRILVADAHPFFASGLLTALRPFMGRVTQNIQVVPELNENLVKAANEQHFHLCILGLSCSDPSIVPILEQIKAQNPQLLILVLASIPDPRFMRTLFRAGIDGFILKTCNSEELGRAVSRVLAGEAYFSKELSLFKAPDSHQNGIPVQPHSISNALTKREMDVFKRLGKAVPSAQIAEELGISVLTVKIHRRNIMNKLQLTSQAAIVKYFYEAEGSNLA